MWELFTCFMLRYTKGPLSLTTFFNFWQSHLLTLSKSSSVPFYIATSATNEVLRGAARRRVGGRLVAPQTLPHLPAQWRECSTQFSREKAWFWTRTSNLTLPPKGHMTSACWSPTGCLVGYMMSRGLFRKQTLELYFSAEACHNLAVHP